LFNLAVEMLMYSKSRCMSAVIGITVAFFLCAAQVGLLVGWCNTTSAIIRHADADVWVMAKEICAFDYGTAIPENRIYQVRSIPGVAWAEGMLQRDDLAIYTNLSRFVEPANSVLAEKPAGAGDKFERRGLEWLIALARVEHQAALVCFTASRSPLSAELPATGGRGAYQELLADGARMHYWAWRQAREKVKSGDLNGGDLVSEARRTVLALEFTKAAMLAASVEEVGAWQQRQHELEQDKDRLVERIGSEAEQRKVAEIDAPRLLFDDGGGDKGRRDDDDPDNSPREVHD
jgi:hypothetical protein